jgi:hypothetical protein
MSEQKILESISITRLGGSIPQDKLLKIIEQLTSHENGATILTIAPFRGVVDLIEQIYLFMLCGDRKSISCCLEKLEDIHYKIIYSFNFPNHIRKEAFGSFLYDFNFLVYLVKNKKNWWKKNLAVRALMLFFGDRFASKIIEQIITSVFGLDVVFLDSKELIRTNGVFANAKIEKNETKILLAQLELFPSFIYITQSNFGLYAKKRLVTTLGYEDRDLITAFISLSLSQVYKSIPVYCSFFKEINGFLIPLTIEKQDYLRDFPNGPIGQNVLDLFDGKVKNVILNIQDPINSQKRFEIFI